MRNLKVIISYKGTKYHGFQSQINAVTVQSVLEKSISKVLNEPVQIFGCSRTDTGVHANEYCFNMHTNNNIPPRNFLRGINGELPDDISILSCEDVHENFHARYDCKAKEYIYLMHCSESKNPFAVDTMLHYRRNFDISLAQKAADHLIGTHDFTSFCSTRTTSKTNIRTIYTINIESNGNFVKILVKGDGFLYNMIRIIVGTLIWVNEGKLSCEDIPKILEAKNRLLAGKTAMPHGLYLNKVYY